MAVPSRAQGFAHGKANALTRSAMRLVELGHGIHSTDGFSARIDEGERMVARQVLEE